MHRQIAGKLTSPVTKWLVFGFWVLVLVGATAFAGPFGSKLSDVQSNEASSWLPQNAESTRALDKLTAFQDPKALPTVVAYHRPSGLTPRDLATMKAQVADFQRLPGVTGRVIGPVPARDGTVAETVVTYDFGKNGWNRMPAAVTKLRSAAAIPGVTVYVTGAGGQAADSAEAFSGIDSTLLLATVIVVVVVLLLTYRSPVLWILPVLSAATALTVAQAVVYGFARYGDLTVNGQSQGILTVLVFGAGTDYALLLVARYREELRRHADRHEAMGFALHRATPAIIASATTVVLGMLCLLVAEMNSTSGLGPVAAIGIVIGVAVMVTLLPALLVITGRWIFWPARPRFGSAEPSTTGIWARVGNAIAPRPRKVWMVTSGLLGLACLGLLVLDAHGLPAEHSYTKQYGSVVGQRLLSAHGLADRSNPVQVVTDPAHAGAVRSAMEGLQGIGPTSPPLVRDGVALVAAPVNGDPTSQAAFATVDRVRAAVHRVPGANALVGGATAINRDIQEASSHDNRVVIPLVLAVVLLVLMVLLRAVLSPVLLVATVLLSFGAALGLSSLLFHYVFGYVGADASFPLYVFVFLVALGIDYNIFLMTRVREETQTRGTREGSLVALAATGGVITSAGLVLAATFSVLSTLPLVAFVEIGVAVALGVVLDTMVVRSVLVTSLNLDLGSRIWWPGRLDRTAD
ncbi:MAG TPA: MMPL family transporter [Marmoricola sp.]